MRRILVIDIGGSHVKVWATGRKEPVEIPSGPRMTPQRMVNAIKTATAGWTYDTISIGYPGRVLNGHPQEDAPNLGSGWKKFDWKKAFGRPVRIVNDAALQALGSYRGGRMLFLGLGTGLGSALVLEGVLHPTELGDLPYRRGRSYAEYLGKAGLKRIGRARWARHVRSVVSQFKTALQVEYVVVGGGKARLLKGLPQDVLLGNNSRAVIGGRRLWEQAFGRALRDGQGGKKRIRSQ